MKDALFCDANYHQSVLVMLLRRCVSAIKAPYLLDATALLLRVLVITARGSSTPERQSAPMHNEITIDRSSNADVKMSQLHCDTRQLLDDTTTMGRRANSTSNSDRHTRVSSSDGKATP